jgi:iron complex outermembrane receptor protein
MNTFRISRLSMAVRGALLFAALPLSVAAQDATSEEVKTLDRVEVTGSRIKTAEAEGLVPVQRITRADIDRSGLTSVGDVIQALTGSGSALNTKFNSSGNFGFPPDGSGVGAGRPAAPRLQARAGAGGRHPLGERGLGLGCRRVHRPQHHPAGHH